MRARYLSLMQSTAATGSELPMVDVCGAFMRFVMQFECRRQSVKGKYGDDLCGFVCDADSLNTTTTTTTTTTLIAH